MQMDPLPLHFMFHFNAQEAPVEQSCLAHGRKNMPGPAGSLDVDPATYPSDLSKL